jgi:CHRD domain
MIRFSKSALAAAMISIAALGSGAAFGADVMLKLSGANEVPPVTTSASGEGTISVADDGAVSGSVMTKGIQGTAAHIHMGAAGKNGPVVVPFTKDGDVYKAPAGAKLDADQLKAFKAGDLYFNVHSAANPGGELRAQLK